MKDEVNGNNAAFEAGLSGPMLPVELYEFTWVDGTALYFTSIDGTVKFTGTPIRHNRVYLPAKIQRSNFTQKRGVEVSQLGVKFLNDPGLVLANDETITQSILSGRWFGASVVILRGVNPTYKVDGTFELTMACIVHVGNVGKVQ